MTGMGRPPLWFYTTTHGPRTKESQVSQPRGRGAGQWPAAGGATHSTHSTQRKRARARARWGSVPGNGRRECHTPASRCVRIAGVRRAGCAEGARLASNGDCRAEQASRESDEEATRARQERDTTKTRRRPRMRRKKIARSAEYARETHVTLAGSRPARAAGMPRERGRRRSALVERSGAKRSDDRNATPPRAKTHIPRTVHDLLDCGGDNHRGDLARGHHMPPALRSLAPCGTADSEAQLASRSSQLTQLAPRQFAPEAPPAAGSRAGASTARSEQS